MSTPSSSAAICARPVSIPWPSEPTPARTTTVPSEHASIDASSNGPIPPSSTIAATPIPTRSTLRGPGLALRLQLREIRLLEHLLEGGREVATRVHDRRRVGPEVVRERHLVGPHEIASAQIDRAHAQLAGQDVEHALAHERRLRHSRTAVRADGRPVRQHRVRGHRERVPGVRPGQMRAGKDRRQDAVCPRVRAEVAPQAVLEGEELAVPARRDGDLVHLLPGVVRGDEMLCAILDPLHRPTEREGEERDEDVLRVELAPHTEASADVDLDQAHGLWIETEQGGRDLAVEVLHLRRAPDREAARLAIVLGDETARLERNAVWRPTWRRRRTTTSAAANAASASPNRSAAARRRRSSPSSTCTSGAPSCRGLDGVDDRALRARFELELHELGGVLGEPTDPPRRPPRRARRRSARRPWRGAAGARSRRWAWQRTESGSGCARPARRAR